MDSLPGIRRRTAHSEIMTIENQEGIEASQTRTESQPLLDRVVVEPLRLVDIPLAADSYYSAFTGDILHRYIGTDPGPGRRPGRYMKASLILLFACRSPTKLTLTIDHGVAILTASFPSRSIFLEKVLESLLTVASLPHKLLIMSTERRKRLAEMEMKGKRSAQHAGIAEHVKDWVYLDLLFATQQTRGRGYGSALVKTLTDQLDSSGQTCWLHALASNEGFYVRHGFQTLASGTLGNDNPEWNEGSFVINVMVRKPKSGIDKKGYVNQSEH